jgi:hypothetical protein
MPCNNYISFWEYLNDNSGAVQAASAALTFVVTTVLVMITAKYVSLTKRLSEASESQLRFQKESKEYSIQQEIIDGSLKFIFKIKDDIDNLQVKRITCLSQKEIVPVMAKDLEDQFLNEANKVLLETKFFPEFMFISYHLQRLKDDTLWQYLQKISDSYEKMINILTLGEGMDEYEKNEIVFLNLTKSFVMKCLDISKVDVV